MPRQPKGKPKAPRKARSRKGMMPGQYRKRSTVYVERLRNAEEDARYTNDDLYTTDAYIVQTNRLDKTFSYTVELKGEMMRLPGKVVDRMIAQREAILKEARSDTASQAAEKRIHSKVVDDVEEAAAEAERKNDLEGL